MGTRGSIGMIRNGVVKEAYNHFDSYPSQLGENFLAYAKSKTIEELEEVYCNLELIDEDSNPTPEQIEKCKEFTDTSVGSGFGWYQLMRKCQGDMAAYEKLGMIPDGSNTGWQEWKYYIDLDNNKFVVVQVYGNKTKKFSLKRLPKNLESVPDYY